MNPVSLGVGLWSMQSTAANPRRHVALYRDMLDSARRLEDLGVDSMWFAEHRAWYDGWCPAPLSAISAAAAVTSELRFGTAMLLLPQHDPARVSDTVREMVRMHGDRLELGVGLGHRDAEFDAVGLRRRDRGTRMDTGLDEVLMSSGLGPEQIWIGGMAPAALDRIGRRDTSALLPQTLHPEELTQAIERIRAASGPDTRGRIGVLKDVHVTGAGADAERDFRALLARHYREEAGAWWSLDGADHGFLRPRQLDRQIERITSTCIVGDPDEVATQLSALVDAGVETIVARLHFDVLPRERFESSLDLFAREVVPALRTAVPA